MEKSLRIVFLYEQPNDYAYWILRPVNERIDAIETLRKYIYKFRKDVEPRLQRVRFVVKQA